MSCLNEGGRARKVVRQDMQGRGVTGYWDVSKGCGVCWNIGCEEGGTGRDETIGQTGSQRGMSCSSAFILKATGSPGRRVLAVGPGWGEA